MKSVKYTVFILLLFSYQSIVNAEIFVDASIGAAFGDVSEPVFAPSHPVSAPATSLERSEDSSTARSLFIGVTGPDGLYAKAGYVDFSALSRFKNQFGSDGTLNFSTSTNRDEDVSTYVVVIGKSFPISNKSRLFVQAGAHRFDKGVSEHSVTTERVIETGSESVVSSVVQRSSQQDTAITYGAGAEIDVSRRVSVLLSASRYKDVDIDTVDVGVRFYF